MMNSLPWKALISTPRAHAIYACMAAVTLIVAANFGAFIGTRAIPWDFLDLHYTEYITGLLAAQHGAFGVYNPYEFGGMFASNVFAYYDPVFWWFPLATHSFPDLYQHQLILLMHVFIIPASLFYMAHLYGIRGKDLYPVAALSIV